MKPNPQHMEFRRRLMVMAIEKHRELVGVMTCDNPECTHKNNEVEGTYYADGMVWRCRPCVREYGSPSIVYGYMHAYRYVPASDSIIPPTPDERGWSFDLGSTSKSWGSDEDTITRWYRKNSKSVSGKVTGPRDCDKLSSLYPIAGTTTNVKP